MPMSPRTQAMSSSGVPSDQAKNLFDQGLSQMAYNVLINKLPNISPDVVTFKILDSEPEMGSGVGAFVVMRQNQTLYIPVVMAENQIKPLDILYYKDLNVFIPLSKEWLGELDKLSLGEMGRGVKPPDTMPTDVDIRNIVVPPTTGRYSYASEDMAVKQAFAVFDQARNTTHEPKLAFLDFVAKAPENVKIATARLFEAHPALLKQAVWFYGEKPLLAALQVAATTKVASAPHAGELFIADRWTKAADYKDLFGPDAGLAYTGVRIKGYHAKDDRKHVKQTIQVQKVHGLQEPKDSGAYRIWKTDGKPVLALVVGNPVNVFHAGDRRVPPKNIRFVKAKDAPADPMEHHGGPYRVPGMTGTDDDHHHDRYVGVTEDGALIEATQLIGEPVPMGDLEGSAVYKKTVGDDAAAGPRSGQHGIFVIRHGDSFIATTPVHVESITDMPDAKHITVSGGLGHHKIVVMYKDSAQAGSGRFMVPTNSQFIYVPSNAVWLPTKSEAVTGDFITNPKDVLKWATEGMLKEGGEKVSVRYSPSDDNYRVGRESIAGFVPALRKLAVDANIAVDEAELVLKKAQADGRCDFWTMDSAKYLRLVKTAEGSPPSSGGSGGGSSKKQEQPDPAQQAMDQVMAAQQQQAQGPSPVDMAVAEQMQNLQSQMQAITQMQQLVQTIQQRASQIAGGGGAAAAPGAAAAAMGGPMDPSMTGAGAPVPGMPGGQDPNAQAQQMQGGGGGGQPQPGMDPNAQAQQMQGGGQPQPGMAMQQGGGPQAAMGGMQPGMDPAAQQQAAQQQQQPPSAMMNSDDGSVDSLMRQVNPQFVEQAGQMQDAGSFDAAALASMAQSPSLKDLVSAYLPNLEKSLDNMGRVLLTLWMDESHIKNDVGNETYIALEDNLRTTFKGLGDLILKINQTTVVLSGSNGSAHQE